MRFDKNGPMDAYDEVLHPAVVASLEHGREKYGDLWRRHMDPNESYLESGSHVIDVHVKSRLSQALECLDFNDIEGFTANAADAVGLLAVTIVRLYLLEQDEGE